MLYRSQKPDRYFRNNGRWEFALGKNYAIQFGLDFLVRSSSEINWILQRNLEFMEDYITADHIPEDQTIAKIKEAIISTHDITILDLIQNAEVQFTTDQLYTILSNNNIYFYL